MTDSQRLRLADWMARALHDPERGYYARQVRTVGRRGDFSTSASTSSVLGEAIAGWLIEELKVHGREVRTVIEVGGGDGSLSVAVRDALGWWKRRKLKWLMVETSKPLREQQEARLGSGGVRWFTEMAAALEACEGRALIFHNELLDAFPVGVWQWSAAESRWQEVGLVNEGGKWREALETEEANGDDLERSAMAPSQWKDVPLRDGQRMEVGTACRDWLRHWGPHWKQGSMLTLDYGDTFPQLYHRQPRGTLRAYFMQQRLAGAQVYENMGRQDITADVNFSDVMRWGEELGWKTAHFMTQRAFLERHVAHLDARAREDTAIAFLADASAAGGAFKALIQRTAGVWESPKVAS